jgi:hypothetical protein
MPEMILEYVGVIFSPVANLPRINRCTRGIEQTSKEESTMTTHHTIDEALNHLMYTTKVIRLKQKLNADFIQHDKELTYLQVEWTPYTVSIVLKLGRVESRFRVIGRGYACPSLSLDEDFPFRRSYPALPHQ